MKLARVVGVPDPRLDEIVVLAVTLREGADGVARTTIKAFLRERVAAYKVPKRVSVLRRRRDPDDRQRHEGAGHRALLALGRGEPESPSKGDHE